MRSTILTISKLILLVAIIILVVLLIIPAKAPAIELQPLPQAKTEELSEDLSKIEALQLESAETVALLFGYLPTPRPTQRPTPRPTRIPTAQPSPSLPVELWLLATKASQENAGKRSYWVRNVKNQSGFWITTGIQNAEGYELVRLIADGFLVKYNGQLRLIKFDK